MTIPVISGLTAPQGFVFSLIPVSVLDGSGAALGKTCGGCAKLKSNNGSECYWCGGFGIRFSLPANAKSWMRTLESDHWAFPFAEIRAWGNACLDVASFGKDEALAS